MNGDCYNGSMHRRIPFRQGDILLVVFGIEAVGNRRGGRMRPAMIVGNSKTMKSRHIPSSNKSGLCEAVDIAPYPIDWNDTKRFDKLAEHIKKKAKQLNIPITWGGDWKTLVDMPHYELKR